MGKRECGTGKNNETETYFFDRTRSLYDTLGRDFDGKLIVSYGRGICTE
jgi:hypothetical protein